jgi:hypothetical protein
MIKIGYEMHVLTNETTFLVFLSGKIFVPVKQYEAYSYKKPLQL